MRLSCPACGATISLDAAIGHEGAREAIQIALRLPASLGKSLIQYLGLFRPVNQRQLSMDRVANLLNELLPMIEVAQIERNGKRHSAPQDYWAMALAEMVAKRDALTLPLKSHGYLLTIIAGYAEKHDAKAEQKTEQTRSKGEFHVAGQPKKRSAPVVLGDVLKKGKE